MSRKTQDKLKLSSMQVLLGIHAKELGLEPEYERPVCEDREWRFDVCFPAIRLACEIHGGQYTGGHRRGKKALRGRAETPQEDEYLKLSTATMLGWRVLQFTNEQVADGRAKTFIKSWMGELDGLPLT